MSAFTYVIFESISDEPRTILNDKNGQLADNGLREAKALVFPGALYPLDIIPCLGKIQFSKEGCGQI